MRIELSYEPQERQQLLHATTAKQVLYGGAAGGGKSYALRWDGYEFCLKNPGCKAYLVRQTLPQLETNHLIEVRNEIPEALGRFNETKKRIDWKNGSVMMFRHCQYDRDLNDFQGAECHWLGVDEATLLQPQHLSYMKSRLRLGKWKPEDPEAARRLPRLVFTGNPGGPSHHYLKAMFIDPAPPETVFTDEDGLTRVFIPAYMQDNAFLDANYGAQFTELPEWQAKQLRDGDWSVVPGAFFDCWSSAEHVIPPFQVPDYWPKYRAVDWGFATPFSIGEWTVSDGTPVMNKHGEQVKYPDGALIRIWEWYGNIKGNEGLRRTADDVAAKVVTLRGKVKAGPADPNMWRADMGTSPAELMIKAGLSIYRADNQREAGWQEMYRRMKAGLLLVCDNCEDFIRTVPALMADQNNPNDVDKVGEDHCGDECFTRGTKVLTAHGTTPIEAVMVGDRVWTRFGLSRVTAAFSVGIRDVYDAGYFVGTGSHPVWVEGQGFTPLSQLRYGDIMRTCTQTNTAKLLGEGGPLQTGLFRRAIRFITLMGIKATTALAIWSASRPRSIVASTSTSTRNAASGVDSNTKQNIRMGCFAPIDVGLQQGAAAALTMRNAPAKNAAPRLLSTGTQGKSSVLLSVFPGVYIYGKKGVLLAAIAVRRLLLKAQRLCGAPAVAVRPIHVGKRKVYNLTVEGDEEYFANGLLVHNCRYMCMSRPHKVVKKPPKRPTLDKIRFSDLKDIEPNTDHTWI